MQKKEAWLLPEGIEEVLPEDAKHLEFLRRKLLDIFNNWGYRLVIPPMVDFLDSLLVGSAHDLELETFKLTDQLSGKLLGVRADMTPQVARLAACNLAHSGPTRLCYVGTVLHTLGDNLDKSRCPMQIGAELYGYPGIHSDLEIIQLMLEMLAISGIQNIHVDLGHVNIFRSLSKQAGLNEQQEVQLFEILQRKSVPELEEFLSSGQIAAEYVNVFLALPKLNGDQGILTKALEIMGHISNTIRQALQDLQEIASHLTVRYPTLPIHFDLSELRGYHYHTGIVFAAFVPEVGKEIARGGRYDNINEVFGRARAATGFSADLKRLAGLTDIKRFKHHKMVFAEFSTDPDQITVIRDLRASGTVVIQELPGQETGAKDLSCTAVLKKINQQWVITPLN